MAGPYTPLAEFIRVAREEGLKARLSTVSFVGTDSLVKLIGVQGNGVIISQVVPFPEDISIPLVKECGEIVKKYSNEPLGFVNLEGCVTAKAIVKAMESMGKDITREGLIRAFEGMKGVDIGGMVFKMGEDDHQASDTVYLTEIRNGKITSVNEISR
jgi:ABC-type branched-subunit amino acid transport system substrate-binding protein